MEEQLFNSADYDKAVETKTEQYAAQQKNSGGLLAMGILSIVLCVLNLVIPFVHIIGIILGIIAVSMASPRMKHKVPLSVGAFVTGLIGIIIGVICIILGIVLVNFVL